jgi:uncharacterized membrane protein YraQ (UPF0718 family)
MVDILNITLITLKKYLTIFPYIVIAYLLIYIFKRIDLKDKIEKLGRRHRILAAYLLGILSHGSIYAWYPILKELGFKEDEIAIVLYNRAIKIPQIPIQIALFGWKFALLLNGFILATSVVYSRVVSYLTTTKKID